MLKNSFLIIGILFSFLVRSQDGKPDYIAFTEEGLVEIWKTKQGVSAMLVDFNPDSHGEVFDVYQSLEALKTSENYTIIHLAKLKKIKHDWDLSGNYQLTLRGAQDTYRIHFNNGKSTVYVFDKARNSYCSLEKDIPEIIYVKRPHYSVLYINGEKQYGFVYKKRDGSLYAHIPFWEISTQ